MKEQLKKFFKEQWKLAIGVFTFLSIAAGILVYNNLDAKVNSVEGVADTCTVDVQVAEKPKMLEETEAEVETTVSVDVTGKKTEVITDIPSTTEGKLAEKTSTVDEDTINAEDKASNKEQTSEMMTEETTSTPTKTSVQENKYIPIKEGWKSSKSAKGDITSSQKKELDKIIESWKDGVVSDAEVSENIINYLDDQGIVYMEVSVTSKGYALYDEISEIDLRNGGNLYSFVGIYSTGKQNPDGTDKTVCYNWSAFVF